MACGLVVVGFFIWFFRVETGPWKLFLLSLPFVKIVYDFLQGLPENSILRVGLDPFTLPARHQLLQVDAGFGFWGPTFRLMFAVKDRIGQEFSASVGDYLTIWLDKKFGSEIPFMILAAALAVSATLIVIRLAHIFEFERRRRADRRTAVQMRFQKLKFRSVDIYLSKTFSGTPFTGGLRKPYICIPVDAETRLSPTELEAVIAHELGHIRQLDIGVTVLVQLLGDLFWFVPGYRWLSRKIDRMREIVADQWAIHMGVEPALLASALLKLREIPEPPSSYTLYSAFFREKSLLKIRIERLVGLASEKRARFGWRNLGLRMLLSIWIFVSVMGATFGGNHPDSVEIIPRWFNQMVQDLRFDR
jgi:Zn-dependent protease with chaperone function